MKSVAVVKRSKCNPMGCGGYLCMKVCPRNRAGDECIVKGDDKKIVINESLCIGCGICPKKCPFNAIFVVNLPEELKKGIIHQYGINSFRVYRLPTPKPKECIGLLGPNGIGKTTTINLLSGAFKPNLGNYEEGADKKQILEFFRGHETQEYFTKLFNNEIELVVKPQHVDRIPEAFKGKVKELLSTITNDYNEIVKILELDNILERDISQISGGELQRVAIAATLLKKSNVVFFDEPSSYLDIKQRLKVAKIIQELSKEKTVFVIEHDLIMLDYMANLIHIMYGRPGVYGVVSLPLSSKVGINTYLDGYIKEENMRFRDSDITFNIKAPSKAEEGFELISWPELSKSFDGFSLNVSKGKINVHEIVGVLGPNGIGKTTFARMLAGILKPDKGEINGIKISYKPQYIKPEKGVTVREVLNKIVKGVDSEAYQAKIINPLDLSPLMNHTLDSLSGGELQRVAIALCLSQKADLYLLDEPSAHLDVEQRLNTARTIKKVVSSIDGASALVIDHDILFLDFLSNRLLVADGTPGKQGFLKGPFDMKEGMNLFLKEVGITMRRDGVTQRPRINKEGSILDREQKDKGEYYYRT